MLVLVVEKAKTDSVLKISAKYQKFSFYSQILAISATFVKLFENSKKPKQIFGNQLTISC